MFALIFLIVIGENCIHLIFVKKTVSKSPPANNLRRQMLSVILKQMFVWSCLEERFSPLWYRI